MKMLPKDFKKKMKEISLSTDPEGAHGAADELMCQLLKELGYSEGVRIFDKMEKWYG